MTIEQGQFTGKTIGNYQIQQLLGRGGFGEAYKADFITHRNTPVVVKFLLDIRKPKLLEGFRREARTLANLDHPNIVPFYRYDVYENGSEKIPYIVMAFANSKSLKERLDQQKLLQTDEAMNYLLQTTEGLEYAHSQKVLHRDLKPPNLLLHKERKSQQAVVLLSDFGIAITAHRLDTGEVDPTKQDVTGSWQYMSPEQFKANARIPSDIYSLGVIAHQLLAGGLPFPVDRSQFTNPIDLMMAYYLAHKETPVPSIEQTRRSHGYDMTYPVGELEVVVARALAKEPKDRYPSAGDFREALERTYTTALEREAQEKRIMDMKASEEKATRERAQFLVDEGYSLVSEGQHEGALRLFTRAIELDPGNGQTYVDKANLLIDLKRYDEAMAVFDEAMRRNPNDEYWYFQKGCLFRDLERHEEALEAFEQASRLAPNSFFRRYEVGRELVSLGRYEEAAMAYDEAINLNPQNSDAYFRKSDALFRLGEPFKFEAIAVFDKAIKLSPNDNDISINRDLYSWFVGFEQAITVYDELISSNPKDIIWYNYKAILLSLVQRNEEAIEVYDQMIMLKPNRYETYYDKGKALQALGRYDEAIAAYDEFIKLRPNGYLFVYDNKGMALFHLGRYVEAIEAYDEAIRLGVDYRSTYYNKGVALMKLGNYEKALQAFEEAIKGDSTKVRSFMQKMSVLLSLDKIEEANLVYKEAFRTEPTVAATFGVPGDRDVFEDYDIASAQHEIELYLIALENSKAKTTKNIEAIMSRLHTLPWPQWIRVV